MKMTLKVMELPFNFGFNKEASRFPGGLTSVSYQRPKVQGEERERKRLDMGG
jgi:hypothetical protein